MGTKQTIYHNLQHFNIDNDEAQINKKVQQSRKWPFKHFFLPKGNQQHCFPTESRLVISAFSPPQSYIADDFPCIVSGKSNRRQQQYSKNDLRYHNGKNGSALNYRIKITMQA